MKVIYDVEEVVNVVVIDYWFLYIMVWVFECDVCCIDVIIVDLDVIVKCFGLNGIYIEV